MEIGEKIKDVRTKNKLSQEQFAELFNVTRQTVSNWENEKSYPDLETLVKISQHFGLATDDLLQDKAEKTLEVAEKDTPNKKNLSRGFIILAVMIIGIILAIYGYYREQTKFSFELNQEQTIDTESENGQSFEVDKGYFNLPKGSKLKIEVTGNIDSGRLIISVVDAETAQEVYQISGDYLQDSQQIYLEKASYEIQVRADNYAEKIVALDYQVAITNQ